MHSTNPHGDWRDACKGSHREVDRSRENEHAKRDSTVGKPQVEARPSQVASCGRCEESIGQEDARQRAKRLSPHRKLNVLIGHATRGKLLVHIHGDKATVDCQRRMSKAVSPTQAAPNRIEIRVPKCCAIAPTSGEPSGAPPVNTMK